MCSKEFSARAIETFDLATPLVWKRPYQLRDQTVKTHFSLFLLFWIWCLILFNFKTKLNGIRHRYQHFFSVFWRSLVTILTVVVPGHFQVGRDLQRYLYLRFWGCKLPTSAFTYGFLNATESKNLCALCEKAPSREVTSWWNAYRLLNSKYTGWITTEIRTGYLP